MTEATEGTTACGPFVMRWQETGPATAPLVVLLHGIYAGAHAYEWRELVPHLTDRYRVRVPDLLGSGESDRPDLEYTRAVVQGAVDALIRDAGPDAHVVASSLTGAYALRAVVSGAGVGSLTLITPTGLGAHREHPPKGAVSALYSLARHTPAGDLLVDALTSAPSVRWFQTNKTYRDPSVLHDDELVETRRAGRLANAKHLQLAFVFGRLALDLSPDDVERVRPTVIWARAQGFTDQSEADRWRAAGARVVELDSGLPQVEEPAVVAQTIGLTIGTTP
jgi:pimeloyl-ACP methyl ester carboxylesterase